MKVELSGRAGEPKKHIHCIFRELEEKVLGSNRAISVIEVPFDEQ